MIGSATSFSGMLSMVGHALWALALIVWNVCVGVVMFLFDSIFPPKESSAIGTTAGSGSGSGSGSRVVGNAKEDMWE